MIADEKDARLSRGRLQKLEGRFVHPHSIAQPRVDSATRLRDTLSMRFAAASGMLAALTLLASPAHAALNICNQTAKPTRVAVGRFDGTAWMSEGWWTLAPKKCASVVPGKLKARYYYLYATDGGAGSWDGETKFCVGIGEDKFRTDLRGHCAARGMDSKGFFTVDTGNDTDYTQTLSD
jgi:uncharacterized membrane protein